ncbi:MAG: VWA domain-containing protein [Verrucomicrobiota bacterium]
MNLHSTYAQGSRRTRAFSLMEAIVAIAILGVIVAIAMTGVSNFKDSSEQAKLDSDVSAINQAIKVYIASGGNLTGVTEPQDILDKLKTRRAAEDEAKYAGFGNSMIDKRLWARMQTASESLTDVPRAIWNTTKNQFEVVNQGLGVKAFGLNPAFAAVDYGEESRDGSAIELNAKDGWIWVYEDSGGPAPPSPTQVALTPVAATPPPPPAAPTRLDRPVIVTQGGSFPYTSFPMSVTLTNPNDPATSEIYYATDWSGAGGINWQLYTGPVSIQPDQQLMTYAKATSPSLLDSYSAADNYAFEPIKLQAPIINTSASELDLVTNAPVSVSLTDPNPAASPREIQYRLSGGAWTTYSGAFNITPQAYANGFTVEARAIPTGTGYEESDVASRTLQIKLAPPEIQLSDAAFSDTVQNITVTLTNPNPAASSTPIYRVVDLDIGTESSWQSYGAPFDLLSAAYPGGFEVQTYARPDQANYIQSDQNNTRVFGFFGVPIAGRTVFVIDASGSMSWNNRLDRVKTEATEILNRYPSDGKFAIIVLNNTATTLVDWTDATPSAVANAITQVNGISAGGSTNYSAALDAANNLSVANPGEVVQVIFLSDGEPTAGDTSETGIVNRVSQLDQGGVRLDSIGFEINNDGEDLLEAMANAGRGNLKKVSN